MKQKKKYYIFKACILSVILIFSVYIGINIKAEDNSVLSEDKVIEKTNDKLLTIHFIDVGQGDSMLINYDDKNMLIDAGENESEGKVVEYLHNNNISKFEYIIGTHADSDHIGGLDKVITNFDVDNILFPKQIKTTRAFEDFINSVKNKDMKLTIPKVGIKYYINDKVYFEILSPQEHEYENSNNYSVVIMLTYMNNKFLFMGDAESEIEKSLIDKQIDLRADLIKIGHHGSNSSTILDFLEQVNPKYAVISVGKDNKYNHPSSTIINRLKKQNIQIYRTDLNGTVIVKSDGNDIIVE